MPKSLNAARSYKLTCYGEFGACLHFYNVQVLELVADGDYHQGMGYLTGFLLLLVPPGDVSKMLHRIGTDEKYTPGYWKGQPEVHIYFAYIEVLVQDSCCLSIIEIVSSLTTTLRTQISRLRTLFSYTPRTQAFVRDAMVYMELVKIHYPKVAAHLEKGVCPMLPTRVAYTKKIQLQPRTLSHTQLFRYTPMCAL